MTGSRPGTGTAGFVSSRYKAQHPAAMALFPAILMLAGCGGMAVPDMPMEPVTALPPPPPAMAPPPPPMPAAIQPTPGLAARERFQLAVNLLQQGDAAHAEAELLAYVAEAPNNALAQSLLAQVRTPVAMLYPAESFPVTLAANETLSTLAGAYLGSVLSFYGLARYNNIANPSRVAAGQIIRIPRTPAAEAALMARMLMGMPVPAEPMTVTGTAGPIGDPWAAIGADAAAGRFAAVIRTAEDNKLRPDRAQAAVLANAYSANSRRIRSTNAMEAETEALRAGQLYLDPANQPENAIAPLSLALEINPMNTEAQRLLASARNRAADGYYRIGLAALQRQDLDGAISAWDKTLAIDPDHRNAQLNRVQAIELKENLERLKR